MKNYNLSLTYFSPASPHWPHTPGAVSVNWRLGSPAMKEQFSFSPLNQIRGENLSFLCPYLSSSLATICPPKFFNENISHQTILFFH